MSKDRTASAESLPFPPTPSASIAGRTMQESVYKQRVDAAPASRRRAEHSHRADRRRRPRPCRPRSAARSKPRRWIASSRKGSRYNRFHTTAMCSPTRASLLTGRNHHRVGNGQIAELANDWDGYSGTHSQEQRAGGRGAEGLRLRDGRLGQVAQHAGRGDHRRPVRSRTGRRASASNISTDSSPARPRNTSRTWCATRPYVLPPKTPGGGLPPQRRPGGRRDRLAAQAQGLPAGQAVLHVLGERRDPRPAPHHEGVGRQI